MNHDGKKVLGREYPWGTVLIENKNHCDTLLLREMLIHSHMEDLKEQTHLLYEKYRASRITEAVPNKSATPVSKFEQKRVAFDQKLAKMEAEMQAVFNQKVAEKEAKLKQTEEEVFFI